MGYLRIELLIQKLKLFISQRVVGSCHSSDNKF